MDSYSGCWFRRASARGWRCFPLYAAQAPGCSIWSVPCAARGSSPRVFHKSAEQKAAPAFCAFPVRATPAARSLTGALSPDAACLLPSAVPVCFLPCQSGACTFCTLRPQPQSPPAPVGCLRPVSRRDPPGGCRPSRISGSL